MKRALIALLLGCVTLMLASAAFAGPEQMDGVAISVHIGPWAAKNVCDTPPVLTNDTIVTEVPGASGDFYLVWILVCNASDSIGVAGLEYGIDYNGLPTDGVDVNNWYLCSDLEFPSATWPDAGSGNLQTWDFTTDCQNTLSNPYLPRSVIAYAGALDVQVFTPDNFYITPRPVSGNAKVGDCFGAEWDITGLVPSHLGVGAFALAGTSWNPCGGPTPVQPSTWGKIKTQY